MRKALLTLALVGIVGPQATASFAFSGAFATFQPNNPPSVASTLTNTGYSATLGTLDATLGVSNYPVEFEFSNQNGSLPQINPIPYNENILGTLSYSASNTTGNFAGISGGAATEGFDSATLTITSLPTVQNLVGGFTVPASTVLLSATVTTTVAGGAAQLSTQLTGNGATFQAEDVPGVAPPGTGNGTITSVTFASPFYVDFSGAVENVWTEAYAGVNPPTSLAGSFPFFYINDFTAGNTTGNFSTVVPNTTPEPGTVAMLLSGGVGAGLLRLRRRN